MSYALQDLSKLFTKLEQTIMLMNIAHIFVKVFTYF